MWIDYDDGHAGGYPHECERCPTCGLHNDNPRALYCSNAWHLTYEDRLPVATKRPIIGREDDQDAASSSSVSTARTSICAASTATKSTTRQGIGAISAVTVGGCSTARYPSAENAAGCHKAPKLSAHRPVIGERKH